MYRSTASGLVNVSKLSLDSLLAVSPTEGFSKRVVVKITSRSAAVSLMMENDDAVHCGGNIVYKRMERKGYNCSTNKPR